MKPFILLLSVLLNSGLLAQWNKLGLDIIGEAADDKSGYVSLSKDGSTVAIGAQGNDGNGNNSGHVRVYQIIGTSWVQKGNDIDGETSNDGSGYLISLNKGGDVIAIGAIGNDATGTNSGHVRVYRWNGIAWVQKGSDINGESGGDYSGTSVSINGDGNVVAIGAPTNDDGGFHAGHVRVYAWNGFSWAQRGNDFDGQIRDYCGQSVSLNEAGDIVVIGCSPIVIPSITDTGYAKVFQWNGTNWIQRGMPILGKIADDRTGFSVSINNDGNSIAIGSSQYINNGYYGGLARIYDWQNSSWVQRGTDIVDFYRSNSILFLSGNGNVLAHGNPISDAVIVYKWDSTSWVQKGYPFYWTQSSQKNGCSIALSNNGDTIAIGAVDFDTTNMQDVGRVLVYAFGSTSSLNESIKDSDLNLFPNPTIGQVTIKLESTEKVIKIKVYKANGELVKNIDMINSNEISIDMSDQPKGLYFFNTIIKNRSKNIKLVKN